MYKEEFNLKMEERDKNSIQSELQTQKTKEVNIMRRRMMNMLSTNALIIEGEEHLITE